MITKMFIVYTYQLEEMARLSMINFSERMTASISKELGIAEVTGKDFKIKIDAAIKDAQQYGFEFEEDIFEFLILKFSIPGLQIKPLPKNFEEILNFPNRSARNKLRLLASLQSP